MSSTEWDRLPLHPLPGICPDRGSVGWGGGYAHVWGAAPKLFWRWCAGLGFGTLSGMFGVFLTHIQMCSF